MHAGSSASVPRRLAAAVTRGLGSPRLAVTLLSLLLLLTLAGTLAQIDASAYEVQRDVFGAWIVRRPIAGLTLPLPGGALLLPLLALNLAIGGVLRLRRARATAGVLVAHLGALLLLVGGMVDGLLSEKGHARLIEPGAGGSASAAEYRDPFTWELRVSEQHDDGRRLVFRLPGARFLHLPAGVAGTFRHADVPLEISISDPLLDARPVPAEPALPGDGPAVDGLRLRPEPPGADPELTVAGVRVAVRDTTSDRSTPALLWGLADEPLRVEADGRRFTLELGRTRYALPFTLELVDFRRELHPGTGMARSFESEVIVADEHGERRVLIAMNRPLRHRGYTVYQSGWGPEGAPEGTPLFSVLAVARNPAEGVPLVACWIIAAGLLLRFLPRLLRFAARESVPAPRAAWPLAAAAVALAVLPALRSPDTTDGPWSTDVLRRLARLPVQEGGRVKPLATLARDRLLALSRRRALPDGRTAVEWLAEALFRPAVAMHERVIAVPNGEVLDALGVRRPPEGPRARLAYVQLMAARSRLVELGTRFAHVDAKQRSAVENQFVDLLHDVLAFEGLLHTLDPLREPGGGGASLGAEPLALLPPAGSPHERPRWSAPGDVPRVTSDPRRAALDDGWATLAGTSPGSDDFGRAFSRVVDDTRALADARGELRAVDLEATLLEWAPFDRAQVLFLVGLGLALLSWLGARLAVLALPARACCLAGAALMAVGIALRCMVRGRPPVTTLYESILFVTLVCVVVCLGLARLRRQRLAGGLAAGLGALGLLLAARHEAHEAADTMPSLVAVLDTNFWLATHVTTVTVGYAAGLLAAVVAHLYLVARVVNRPAEVTAPLARTLFGLVAFTLVTTLVGTILGGLWADRSWGRFWGWDPKENGALMIVLWALIVLHGRLVGWWRDDGTALLGVVGGALVVFSWWGVNQLGVGLHSYGFTDGVAGVLVTFWAVEAGVLALAGAGLAWRRRGRHPAPPSTSVV